MLALFPASNVKANSHHARGFDRRASYSRGRAKFDNWVATLLANNPDITLAEIALRTRHTLPQVEQSFAFICRRLGPQADA